MLLTAALALSLFNPLAWMTHPLSSHPAIRRAHVGAWSIAIARDRFSGTSGCSITGKDVSLHAGTAIFRLTRHGDTTRAVFRLDGGPPRAISDTFDAVQVKGFFPQRGWIVDPDGGEAALPASYLSGIGTVTWRASPKQGLRRIKVVHLDEAIATARVDGCQDVAP